MQRRTFLQTLLISFIGPGWPTSSRASRPAAPGLDRVLCSLEPTDAVGVRRLFFGFGAQGVSVCRRFTRLPERRPRVDCLRALDRDDMPAALDGVDADALCLLILGADDPQARDAASRTAHAIETRGALLTLALVLHPPGIPWPRVAEETWLTALRATTHALVLVPDGEVPGDPRSDARYTPMQTLGLFALAPSLIDCGLYDLRQALGRGGLWLARWVPFAGIEQGANTLAAIDCCLDDLGAHQPTALIAKWQASLRDISLATYDAIADACAPRIAPGGEMLVTTGLLPVTGEGEARLLLLVRVA